VIVRCDELTSIAMSVVVVLDGGHVMLLVGDVGIGKIALWVVGLCLVNECGYWVFILCMSLFEI